MIAVRFTSKVISSGGKIMYTTWASDPISNSLTKISNYSNFEQFRPIMTVATIQFSCCSRRKEEWRIHWIFWKLKCLYCSGIEICDFNIIVGIIILLLKLGNLYHGKNSRDMKMLNFSESVKFCRCD